MGFSSPKIETPAPPPPVANTAEIDELDADRLARRRKLTQEQRANRSTLRIDPSTNSGQNGTGIKI